MFWLLQGLMCVNHVLGVAGVNVCESGSGCCIRALESITLYLTYLAARQLAKPSTLFSSFFPVFPYLIKIKSKRHKKKKKPRRKRHLEL